MMSHIEDLFLQYLILDELVNSIEALGSELCNDVSLPFEHELNALLAPVFASQV